MRLTEAIDLIRPAVHAQGGSWADFGAGAGLFTRALAELIGPSGEVLAIERDPRALEDLGRATGTGPGAEVVPIQGDFQDLPSIRSLAGVRLDGGLFANSLHFAADAGRVLRSVARLLKAGGRLVVVEYQGRPASRWVPYPVSVQRLDGLSAEAGLGPPRVVGERPSAYGGTMYCALLERSGDQSPFGNEPRSMENAQ